MNELQTALDSIADEFVVSIFDRFSDHPHFWTWREAFRAAKAQPTTEKIDAAKRELETLFSNEPF